MSFPSLNYNFLYTFFLEGYRWVMDFKATASRGVLIAQFEEYFDDALQVIALSNSTQSPRMTIQKKRFSTVL